LLQQRKFPSPDPELPSDEALLFIIVSWLAANMNPLFRLKLDYISRIPMLTVEEFRTLPTSELEARSSALAIPVLGPPREITICQGIRAFPDIPLTVQQFSPAEGDVTHKTWTNQDGEVKRVDLSPFAIADPQATSAEYRAILKERWTEWARAKDEEQYRLLAELYLSEQVRFRPPVCPAVLTCAKTTRQGKELLENFGPFALAYSMTSGKAIFVRASADRVIALKMGSAWVSSPDTLDMHPVVEQGYPLHGKVALPSIVKAQFDALSSLLMTTFQRGVETSLETLNGAADWQVLFVVVAVLGDLVSRMRTDRARHAKQRGIKSLFVSLLQAPFISYYPSRESS
jgi:hypothetical protein